MNRMYNIKHRYTNIHKVTKVDIANSLKLCPKTKARMK